MYISKISITSNRFKDGESLETNKDYIVSKDEVENTYTLVVPKTDESHAGKYSIKATNEHGTDESSVRVKMTISLKSELY